MAALARTLRALDVDVDVIADIDVLNDETVLQNLVIALGGDWPAIQSQARPVKLAIEQHKPWLTSGEMSKELIKLASTAPDSGEFPKSIREKIITLFRKASPWDAVKDAGEAAIPKGQPTNHFRKLQGLCQRVGLWIVPVGELEGFCKSEGSHGPRWAQRILESRDLENDPELEAARNFIKTIWMRPANNPTHNSH